MTKLTDVLTKPIREVMPQLSKRTMNALHNDRVFFMFQLLSMKKNILSRTTGIAKKGLAELITAIEETGFEVGQLSGNEFLTSQARKGFETDLNKTYESFMSENNGVNSWYGKKISDLNAAKKSDWFENILPSISTSDIELLIVDLIEDQSATAIANLFSTVSLGENGDQSIIEYILAHKMGMEEPPEADSALRGEFDQAVEHIKREIEEQSNLLAPHLRR